MVFVIVPKRALCSSRKTELKHGFDITIVVIFENKVAILLGDRPSVLIFHI